jgi:hypothetical protein
LFILRLLLKLPLSKFKLRVELSISVWPLNDTLYAGVLFRSFKEKMILPFGEASFILFCANSADDNKQLMHKNFGSNFIWRKLAVKIKFRSKIFIIIPSSWQICDTT